MSPVGTAVTRLNLQRAIAKGEQVRDRWHLAVQAAREDLAAIDEAWSLAVAEQTAAGEALHQKRQAHPGLGVDYWDLGHSLHPHGTQPPEWATEYRRWTAAQAQVAELTPVQTSAAAKLRTAESALAAATKQLSDWQQELAALERGVAA